MNERLPILTVAFLSLLVISVPAQAGTAIVPPLVTLTEAQPVATLNITNDRNVSAGYSIEAFGWQQEPNGKVLLPPTGGVRVEPTNVDIPAHGSAQIQVTAQVPAPPTRKPGECLSHTHQ